MQQYVKTIGDERLEKVPGDLDLKPYRDEHDYELMRRMRDAAADPGHEAHADAALRRRLDKALAGHPAKTAGAKTVKAGPRAKGAAP